MEKLLNRAVAYMKTCYQHILSAVLITLLVFIVHGDDLEILVNEALQTEAQPRSFNTFFAGFLLI